MFPLPDVSDINNVIIQNLSTLYSSYYKYIENIRLTLSQIEIDLVTPVNELRSFLKDSWNEGLSKLKNLKKNGEKLYYHFFNVRLEYYKASKKVKDLSEVTKTEIFDGKTQVSLTNKENLEKAMAIASDLEHIYKYELMQYNNEIKKVKEEYNSCKFLISQLENKYKEFISKIINQFNLILTELDKHKNEYKNQCQIVLKTNNKISTTNEIKNNFLLEENYVSYKELLKNDPNTKLLDFDLCEEQSGALTEKEFNEFIGEIMNQLFSEKELDLNYISKSIKIINDSQFDISKKFVDVLLEKKKDVSLKFLNLQNLQHLANFLCHIALNCISVFSGKFELNFKIIFLAERFFYQDPELNTKIYLSALISKNKYFRTKYFWRDVIELKLANKIQDHITRLQSFTLPEEKKSFFSKIGASFGYNNELRKTSLVNNCRIKKLIRNYDKLNDSKIPILDKILTKELGDLIRDTIPNFSNFNFPCEEALDMIAELAQEYKLPKENIKYYVNYQNVSNYTIRKKLPSELKNNFKKKININKARTKNRYLLLFSFSLKYLSSKDYITLLLIDKKTNQKIGKKIYKIIFKKENLSNEVRLKLWRNILHVDQLKKEYNYEIISENRENIKVPVEVKMDVARTNVYSKTQSKEEIKEILIRILNAISICNNDIKYCQGMNYLAEILYEITQDEKESFYFMMGIFKFTEYPRIFEKDLTKLKVFFYVFQRIVSLFEPELSSFFNSHNVDVNLFLPSWFITLFLTARQYNTSIETPIVLIRILDNFFISGWKFMMKVAIKIIHLYEHNIMERKYEDMLTYLINDMPKSQFFMETNSQNIENVLNEKNITKDLIFNIENEYDQKCSYDKIDKN